MSAGRSPRPIWPTPAAAWRSRSAPAAAGSEWGASGSAGGGSRAGSGSASAAARGPSGCGPRWPASAAPLRSGSGFAEVSSPWRSGILTTAGAFRQGHLRDRRLVEKRTLTSRKKSDPKSPDRGYYRHGEQTIGSRPAWVGGLTKRPTPPRRCGKGVLRSAECQSHRISSPIRDRWSRAGGPQQLHSTPPRRLSRWVRPGLPHTRLACDLV